MIQNKFKFKSDDNHYHKERLGFKPNTVRTIDLNDERFLDLIYHAHKGFDNLEIEIVNAQTNDYFVREVTDIDIWNNLMIISWKHKESEVNSQQQRESMGFEPSPCLGGDNSLNVGKKSILGIDTSNNPVDNIHNKINKEFEKDYVRNPDEESKEEIK